MKRSWAQRKKGYSAVQSKAVGPRQIDRLAQNHSVKLRQRRNVKLDILDPRETLHSRHHTLLSRAMIKQLRSWVKAEGS